MSEAHGDQQVSKLEIPEVSLEEAQQLAVITWGQMYDASFRALAEKLGQDEALEIMRPYLEKVGEPAPIFAQMKGIEGNDARAIASLFCLYEEKVLNVEGEVTESSPERVVKQSTKCPFQEMSSGFCWAFTSIAEGMAKAINPEYKVSVTRMMTEGDSLCEWVVEKKY